MASEGASPADASISDFRRPELGETPFCRPSPPLCGHSLSKGGPSKLGHLVWLDLSKSCQNDLKLVLSDSVRGWKS